VQRRVYGASKQGAAFGHAKIASKLLLVHGLNALAATLSTPVAAPVVTTARLRGGNAGSARGAASLVIEALDTARAAGAVGMTLLFASRSFSAVSACRVSRGARTSGAGRGGWAHRCGEGGKQWPGDVALEAAADLAVACALCPSACEVGLGRGSVRIRGVAITWRALLSAGVPTPSEPVAGGLAG
jgi:hypothetical protein